MAIKGALSGMKKIAEFCQRSESSILKIWKMYDDFPIKKLLGVWESNEELLSDWHKKYIDRKEISPIRKIEEKKTKKK